MLQETMEPAWLDAFEAALGRCGLQRGDTVAVPSGSQSRPVLPELARLAAGRLGTLVFSVMLPSVFASQLPVARSTGASPVLRNTAPVVDALAASHVGDGLNDRARCDSMALYDKRDFNGTELRAFAGNFLYSTGANEVAGRHTPGHFDLPLRNCTVRLDGAAVVDQGKVLA